MAKKKIYSHASATFNGTNEYINRTSNFWNYQHYALPLGTVIGISVWSWIKTSSTAAQWIMGLWNNAAGDNGWGISVKATTGLLVGEIWHDEAAVEGVRVESDIAVNDGEWHLVAMVYDGTDGLSQASNITLYVDGIPVPSTIITDTLTRVGATGTLTSTATPNDGDTVTIGTPSIGNGTLKKVYTFQTSLTDVDGNVAIGGSQAQAMENLRRAINLDGTGGVNYAASMTQHPDISATDTATTVDVTANVPTTLPSVGNEITTTETSSVMSWGGATLSGADNKTISTGTIQSYSARKGVATSPDYFAGQQADQGWMYRALTQSEIWEIWGGGCPSDPKSYSFASDLSTYGNWFNGGNGGDAWDGGDNILLVTDNGRWLEAFGASNSSGDITYGSDINMEGANNYDFKGPYRGFLHASSTFFDGSDDHVDMGDVHGFERTDTFSISFWFNTVAGALQAIVAKGDVGAGAGYEVSMDASGSIHLFLTNTTTTDEVEVQTTATDLDNGAWHHCVVTYDGSSSASGVHIYIDNTDEALTTNVDTLTSSILNSDPLRFGARSDGNERYTGYLTNVAFFDAELSSGQVTTLFNDTASAFTHQGITLNGSDEYVTMGDQPELDFAETDSFSISMWLRWTEAHDGHPVVKALDSGTFRGYFVAVQSSGGEITWFLRNTVTTDQVAVETTAGGFGDGRWHHVVVIYDGSTSASGMHIWVDGVDQPLTTLFDTLSATISTTAPFVLGARNGAEFFFNGQIDDVAVYDSELTSAQVLTIFNKGVPSDLTVNGPTANLVGYWLCGDGDTSPTLTDNSSSGNDGTMTNMDVTNFVPVNGAPFDLASNTLWLNLIGWWLLEGVDTASTISDRSSTIMGGGQNDGTTSGGPTLAYGLSRPGQDLQLNVNTYFDFSAGQFIDCGDVATFQFDNTDPFSLECWFLTEDTAATHFLMGKRLATGNLTGYAVFITTGGIIGFQRINDNSPSNYADVRTVEGFDSGVWRHLVVTTDGTNPASGMNIYVDGKLRDVTVAQDTLSASILAAVAFQIGCINSSTATAWQGSVADVAVYNVELTATQVVEHFNASNETLLERGRPTHRFHLTSAPDLVAWYPFVGSYQEGSTYHARDHSIQSFNHGTFSGTRPGLGQLFEDGPEGSYSALMGESAGQQAGPGGAGPSASFATPEPQGMRLPVEQNDGLGFVTTRVRWGIDDLNAPAGQAVAPGGGGGVTTYFQMRGIDNGTSAFTTWTVLDDPDPNGAQANAGNTTPTLVGTIVAGSGIVISSWQQ